MKDSEKKIVWAVTIVVGVLLVVSMTALHFLHRSNAPAALVPPLSSEPSQGDSPKPPVPKAEDPRISQLRKDYDIPDSVPNAVRYLEDMIDVTIDKAQWAKALGMVNDLMAVTGAKPGYAVMHAQCLAGTNQMKRAWDSCKVFMVRWPSFAPTYALAAEIALCQKDLDHAMLVVRGCEKNVKDAQTIAMVKATADKLRKQTGK